MNNKKGKMFEQLSKLKGLLKTELKEYASTELKSSVQRLANWQYKSKKEKKEIKLTKEDAIIFDFLLKYKYNPSTVYRWLLLEESPKELQEQLILGTISLRDASKLKKTSKNELAVDEKKLRNMVLACVEQFIEV